jgi:hypothetical protein
MDWEKIQPVLWSAAGGAVVLAIVGFAWGGWVTGSTAQQMAADAAEEAVVDRLASICVGQYNRDPEKDQKLENMKAMDSWKRGDYVKELGWSTMPGEKDSDSAVSRTCANLLSEIADSLVSGMR